MIINFEFEMWHLGALFSIESVMSTDTPLEKEVVAMADLGINYFKWGELKESKYVL